MRETARLVAALTGARVSGSLPPSVDAIASDSRAVAPGTLFVALRGERTDGHAYVDDAISRGATVIIAEHALGSSKDAPPSSVALVTVPDTHIAASQLADAFYDYPARALTIVGITGTNGKTTTTHLVRDIFEAAGTPCGIVGTLGAEFRDQRWPLGNTTPLPLELHRQLAVLRDAGAQAVAMEVSSHALALHRVDHIPFRVGALTNITRDHLDFHGTLERYAAAKRRLFEAAEKSVLNEDDAWGARFLDELLSANREAIGYAIEGEPHGDGIRAADLRLSGDGSTFRVTYRGTSHELAINLPGRFNVSNALAAIGCAIMIGIPMPQIRRGLAATRAVSGRMERIGAFGINAIVDYAHTPDALENVLRAAREMTKRELIVVFGCGGDRDPGKRREMGDIAVRLADRIIVTSDNPRSEDPMAIAQAVTGGFDGAQIELDRRAAICRAIDEAQAGDTVVIAGKGHEAYQIVGDEIRPFDDRDEVRNAFAKRGRIHAGAPRP